MSKHPSRIWLALFLALVLAWGAGCSATTKSTAVKAEEDTSWMFHDIAGIELIQENAVMPKPEGVLIVDSRPYKPKFVNGHIPTAISMPFSKFDEMTDKLPEDKNALLIFYCEGPT